jgi:hypothetical protein
MCRVSSSVSALTLGAPRERYAHYLSQSTTVVHLYGPKPPPGWLRKLPLRVKFVCHNDRRLFKNEPVTKGTSSVKWNVDAGEAIDVTGFRGGDITKLTWGQWDWPLTLSTPERAIFELLDELPNHETFEQVDALFSGLANLRPDRLQKLLKDCASVKVKRLLFFRSTQTPMAQATQQGSCRSWQRQAYARQRRRPRPHLSNNRSGGAEWVG